MGANPFLGIFFHWLGGLASGSFYVPYRGVKKWAWETYWLVGGFFSWIIAPWVLGFLLTKGLIPSLQAQTLSTLWWTYFWGSMWGLGGLTFGLTMRYLGMSLGMAVALSYCSFFGTIMPPLFEGKLLEKFQGNSGLMVLIGIIVCLIGIAIAGVAGMSKEREMPMEEKKKSIKEFNFMKGMLVATFSGIMSASFAYGLTAGKPIAEASIAHGTDTIWSGLPKLVVVLAGGFTTNFIWCVMLNIKNKTGYEYFSSTKRPNPKREDETIIETAIDAPSEEVVEHMPDGHEKNGAERVPMLANYIFSAMAGITWYLQFFFYTMGETKMGKFQFSSWTLHMASIIIFSSLWGIALKEWKGASKRTHALITLGLLLLVASTIIIGYGNYLDTLKPAGAAVAEGAK